MGLISRVSSRTYRFLTKKIKIMPLSNADAEAKIAELVSNHKVVIFSKSYCPYCDKAKNLLKSNGVEFFALELDNMPGSDGATIQSTCKAKTGLSSVPNIWINGKFLAIVQSWLQLTRMAS